VNYNIDPARVTDLYTDIGVDYKTKIIDPAIQEVVKAVTASYTAEELTKRPAVTDAIQTQLTDRLQTNHINVTAVSIVNFNFSDQFNQAIEAKITAEQTLLQPRTSSTRSNTKLNRQLRPLRHRQKLFRFKHRPFSSKVAPTTCSSR